MTFRLAEASDDCQLRSLMRETIVPGHIRMAYTREPNFFDAYRAVDTCTQVIVAEENNRIEGVACRSVRSLLVNGEPCALGYLSGLRIRPCAQKGTALARGYAYLKTLHADRRAPAYLTTIIQGNEEAKRILTSGRVFLPSYLPLGKYLTHVCPVKRGLVPIKEGPVDLDITTAEHIRFDMLTEYLCQEGATRQFFPVYGAGGDSCELLRSIGLQHILVAQRGGQIVGTIAVWDQQNTKQHVIAGYSRLFQAIRPFLNFGLRAWNYYKLPNVGESVRCGSVALLCIRNNERAVFNALLAQALSLAARLGLHQLAVGLHERDPLIPAMRGYFHIVYRSWLYLVSWDGNAFYENLDQSRIPYLELGTL